MQLRIHLSVTLFAVSLASLAQSLVIDQTNVSAFGQTNFSPLVRRLLQITARKRGGLFKGIVKGITKLVKGGAKAGADIAGTTVGHVAGDAVGSAIGTNDDYRESMDCWCVGERCNCEPDENDPGGAQQGLVLSEHDTWRQSMDCWCAGERCNCDVGRTYDGCVRMLENQLTYMAHCSPSAATQPRTYSCQSDRMEHHNGQLPIRSIPYYRARCPMADVLECQGARLLAMECWCYNTGDCLCGQDKDEQRTFNCTSNDPTRNDSLPLAPVGRVYA